MKIGEVQATFYFPMEEGELNITAIKKAIKTIAPILPPHFKIEPNVYLTPPESDHTPP